MNHIATTEYQQQTNHQAKCFNSTLILRLRQYVSGHQMDWETYLLPLTYTYNVKVHRSMKISPFSLALRRAPPRDQPPFPQDHSTCPRTKYWPHLCMESPALLSSLQIFARNPATICNRRKGDTRKTTSDRSALHTSLGSATTSFWTGLPCSALLQNYPPLKDLTNYHTENRDLIR